MKQIKEMFADKKKVLVAFSGGVDSSVLAALVYELLKCNSLSITINMQSTPSGEIDLAEKIAREIGIKHKVIDFNELKVPEFVNNTPNRCYYCKQHILEILKKEAVVGNYDAIVEGTNISEVHGTRPGMKAIEEMRPLVISPFVQFKVSKEEIRQIAAYFRLSVTEKPSSPCLASRVPYGQKITPQDIGKIRIAEHYLLSLGLNQVRVRYHNNIARIEVVPEDFNGILIRREEIIRNLKDMGFQYVTLDLVGFRSGSLDEVLF